MDIILVSSKENRTINIHMKVVFLILLLIFVVFVFVLFILNASRFTTTAVDLNKLSKLKEENKIVRQEITRIEKEIFSIDVLIDSLELYDKKLRTFASLTPINEDLRNMGVGGYDASYEDQKVVTDLDKRFFDFSQTLDNLLARAKLQKASFDELFATLEEKKYLQDNTPSIIPVQGWLIRGFGYHVDPFTGIIKIHEGLDIAAPLGTPIIAPADGIVKFAGSKGDFGLALEIDHGYGLTTIYGHCQRIKVARGARVKRGDIVAYVGNTGKSTGPHVHYEVHLSQNSANPINYIITTSVIAD